MSDSARQPLRHFEPLATPLGWAGLPITLELLPGQAEVGAMELPEAAVAGVRSGRGRRWWTTAGRTQVFYSAPGVAAFAEAGLCLDRARWDGIAGEVVMIQLPPCMVNRLVHADVRPFALQTRLELFAPPLANVVNALWDEASRCSPHSPMYAEGLTIALLGLLTTLGGPSTKRLRSSGQFGSRDKTRLQTYIAEHLSGDLRISRLAEEVHMSPYHFARMFKATFGKSPHAFVLERRIDVAANVLRSTSEQSITEIASECGFSSQAHFTEAFRRMLGTTPARWRRGT